MAYYHYCTTETFRQIFTNKCLWLSSMRSSNDAMEGRWATKVIAEAAAEMGFEHWQVQDLDDFVTRYDGLFDCLGFCLSKAEDALSQWRGYADDGRGVALRFSEKFLINIATEHDAQFVPVVYQPEDQKALVRPFLAKAKRLIDAGALRVPERGSPLLPKSEQAFAEEERLHAESRTDLFLKLLELQNDWFRLKNRAFAEEEEWRIARPLWDGEAAEYRTRDARLVPYREISFKNVTPYEECVDKIILGPKNPTPVRAVEAFLERVEWGDASVVRSSATYR